MSNRSLHFAVSHRDIHGTVKIGCSAEESEIVYFDQFYEILLSMGGMHKLTNHTTESRLRPSIEQS